MKLIEVDAPYRPRGNDIDLAAHDLFQKPIELRPFVAAFGAADAFIGKFVGDDPSLSTTNRLDESLALGVDGLSIFRRDPKVEANTLSHGIMDSRFQARKLALLDGQFRKGFGIGGLRAPSTHTKRRVDESVEVLRDVALGKLFNVVFKSLTMLGRSFY